MSRLRHELGLLAAAVRFLTRLPVPSRGEPPADELARAAKHFPIVGLVIGVVAGAVWLIAEPVVGPGIAAGLAVAASVLATGGLHEDGFSDTCDGLGGGGTRERSLEIMRDSHIGAYGSIGLILSLGLRWMAVATLAPWAGFAALVVAHAIGRGMIVVTLAVTGYARESGTAAGVAGGVEPGETAVALLLALAIALLFAGWGGLYALCIGAIAGGIMISMLVRKIGGYTGDGLGAVEQVAEAAALITLAGALS